MECSMIDFIFFIILIVCIIIATVKGFVRSCLSKLAFVLSILISISFIPRVTQIFVKWVDIKYVTEILAFLSVFIVAFLLLKVIQLVIEKLFSGRILKSLDRALGFFWGVLLGLAIVLVILIGIKMQPFGDCTKLLEESCFADFLLPFIS